ncbi:O-methyltransferase family 2 protein [Rutstroemia sp. NJR-2017a BVV2]|nr:O-methyltransferase family 2 protein [Rutstroemia sp. NJR-2017a BVV2]
MAYVDELALHAIYHYKLAQAVPLSGSTTFAEIAQASHLREDLVERFIRQAMCSHIFTEDAPGQVRHTSASRLLATNPDAHDAVGMITCDLSPAGMQTLSALEKYPNSEEKSETGWAQHTEPGISPFEFMAKNPERGRRFGAGMRYFSSGQHWDLGHLARGYTWAALDRPGAVFVDVGGGHGTVSQYLARETKHVEFVIQDLPGTVEAGRKILPEDLRSRVRFMEHDFFTEQPVRGADVYFFRWILHNWSDGYCKKILRALIPALKKGARVLVYEYVLVDGPETRVSRKQPRNLDLMMLAQFNSCERTAKMWEELLRSADQRLRLLRCEIPEGSLYGIIEAVWDGDD